MGTISDDMIDGITYYVNKIISDSYRLIMETAKITEKNGNVYTIKLKEVEYKNVRTISTQTLNVDDTVKVLGNLVKHKYTDLVIIGKLLHWY